MENPWSPPSEPDEQEQARVLFEGASIYAGFGQRCAALLLDTVIVVASIIGLSSVDVRVPMPWGFIAALWVYFALMECSPWQATLGKRALGIKVVDRNGCRVGFWRAAMRNFWSRVLFWLALGIVPGMNIFGVSAEIPLFVLFFVGYMMVDWTARRQTLYDKLAGTFVVHDIVQPSQLLPEKRPLFPWYGRVFNTSLVSVCTLAICLFFMTVNDAEDNYGLRARVAEVLSTLSFFKEEVNNEGCHPGSRLPPDEKIAAIEVSDDGAGRCTITATLGKFPHKAAALNGGKISLTRKEDGQWTCASANLPPKYLPTECRH